MYREYGKRLIRLMRTGIYARARSVDGLPFPAWSGRIRSSNVWEAFNMANYVTVASDKKKSTAFLLCLFFGWVGAHYFYVGKFGRGFLYMFTAGLFIVGWVVDLFKIANGTFRDNVGAPLRNSHD